MRSWYVYKYIPGTCYIPGISFPLHVCIVNEGRKYQRTGDNRRSPALIPTIIDPSLGRRHRISAVGRTTVYQYGTEDLLVFERNETDKPRACISKPLARCRRWGNNRNLVRKKGWPQRRYPLAVIVYT